MELKKINDKIYMLAKSLKVMSAADISGEQDICSCATQTIAEELLELHGQLQAKREEEEHGLTAA